MRQSDKQNTIKLTKPIVAREAGEIASTSQDTTLWPDVNGNKVSQGKLALSTTSTTTIMDAQTLYPDLWAKAPVAWQSGFNLVVPVQGVAQRYEEIELELVEPSHGSGVEIVDINALNLYGHRIGNNIICGVNGNFDIGSTGNGLDFVTLDYSLFPFLNGETVLSTQGSFVTNVNGTASPSTADIRRTVVGTMIGTANFTMQFVGDFITTTNRSIDGTVVFELAGDDTVTTPYITLHDNIAAGALGLPEATAMQAGVLTLDQNAESNKNYIINGGFDFFQRGTSQTASGYESADRFKIDVGGSTTQNASRQEFTLGQTDVPQNPKFYLRNIITTGNGTADAAVISHRLEGVKNFTGNYTLSFYAKADANKDIAIDFRQIFGSGGSPSAAVFLSPTTISLTSSWQFHQLTINVPSLLGKTLGTNNNDYLDIRFWLDAGSDFDAFTNSLGNQSGTFEIAQIKFEEGSQASKFTRAGDTFSGELALCQRFYLRINSAPDPDLKPSAYDACCVSTTRALGTLDFPNQMRDYPSYSFSALSDFRISGITPTVMGLRASTLLSAQLDLSVASGLVDRAAEQVEFLNENGFIAFDSEL